MQESSNYKQDINLFFNLKEIEKIKLKSEYVKQNSLWMKLSQEQKQLIINKYIDEIEVSIDKNYNVKIENILFNKNEIENIGYMFRNDCFDMIMNIEDNNLIISNTKSDADTEDYIANLREYYNIKETTLVEDLFDIDSLNSDGIIQIISQEKISKFEKNKFRILHIEA